MSDAVAHAVYVLAQNRGLVQDTSDEEVDQRGQAKAKDRTGNGAAQIHTGR